MTSYIHSISTAVPETYYEQDFLCQQMKKYVADNRRMEHLIHRIYNHSGIEKRHTVINDFVKTNGQSPFYFQDDHTIASPSTGERNQRFTRHATPLLRKTGEKLLDTTPDIDRSDITHVITVSCTGFFAPGPDLSVVRHLGLSKDTRRYNLGFMGCYAAVSAMQLANTICRTDPDHCVMVICLELCTLHFQITQSYDNLAAASLFADGAAGALISGKTGSDSHQKLQMDRFYSTYIPEGEEDMAWSIGDSGFNMVLSNYVPRIIESNLQAALQPLTNQVNKNLKDFEYWALHPGGKAIIDKLKSNFGLRDSQVYSSRKILAQFGNMSSATILFVLEHILNHTDCEKGQQLFPLAFGPGLTIESGVFTIA